MAIRKEAKVSTFLKEVNLFEGLDKKILNEVFKIGMVQNFKKGDLIVREEQPSGNLYILITGKAEVVLSHKGKPSRKVLAKLNRGSVVGEMSVFDGAPASATVRAAEDCDVHIIRGADFEAFLQKNPRSAYVIMRSLILSLSNRLRRTNLALSLVS
jgi:CRP/FNR family transcriptional regulator, cyclic AMP receptor protein